MLESLVFRLPALATPLHNMEMTFFLIFWKEIKIFLPGFFHGTKGELFRAGNCFYRSLCSAWDMLLWRRTERDDGADVASVANCILSHCSTFLFIAVDILRWRIANSRQWWKHQMSKLFVVLASFRTFSKAESFALIKFSSLKVSSEAELREESRKNLLSPIGLPSVCDISADDAPRRTQIF